MIPRAAKVGLRYAQSFLMQSLLSYLAGEGPEAPQRGLWLHRSCGTGIRRLGCILRIQILHRDSVAVHVSRSPCTLLYARVTEMGSSTKADAAPLTLVSADVANVQSGLLLVHELWGNTAEVAIGCWLLYERIGLAFLAPLVVVLACLFPLGLVLTFLGKRQDQWMSKVQARVGVTSSRSIEHEVVQNARGGSAHRRPGAEISFG